MYLVEARLSSESLLFIYKLYTFVHFFLDLLSVSTTNTNDYLCLAGLYFLQKYLLQMSEMQPKLRRKVFKSMRYTQHTCILF